MKQFILPVRLVALAAFEAARIHGEDPADVFDEDKPSRGRLIALEALRRIYPLSSQISIARHFGWQGSGKALWIRVTNAKTARWWNDDDVSAIAMKMAPHSAVREREPTVAIVEDVAARIYRGPARQPLSRRNVTGHLMGDPGHASYRITTNQRSFDR